MGQDPEFSAAVALTICAVGVLLRMLISLQLTYVCPQEVLARIRSNDDIGTLVTQG